ncbi:MAG: hypothetical protein F6K41_23505 [Symploca sp. SIO3E6]|nr:hypothetical protein [Caldora sp. SIO3E6]
MLAPEFIDMRGLPPLVNEPTISKAGGRRQKAGGKKAYCITFLTFLY